jgi:hypothetical protein
MTVALRPDDDSDGPQPVTPKVRTTATVRATFVRQRKRSKLLRPSAERWTIAAGSAERARDDTDRRVLPLLRARSKTGLG